MKSQTFGIETSLLPFDNAVRREQVTFHLTNRERLRMACVRYQDKRENGQEEDASERPFPMDGEVKWVREAKLTTNDLNGANPREEYWRVKYTEGPEDKAWIEEQRSELLKPLGTRGRSTTGSRCSERKCSSDGCKKPDLLRSVAGALSVFTRSTQRLRTPQIRTHRTAAA